MNIEEKVAYLIRNNLKWEVSEIFPIRVLDRFEDCEYGVAAIELYEYPTLIPTEIQIHDLRTGKTFTSNKFPKMLWVVNIPMDDEILTQLLLHELNHWYSHELVYQENFYHEMDMQEHGKEFKKYGKIIGLDARFNRANVKFDLNKKTVHVGICRMCGKECMTTTSKRDMNEQVRHNLSDCCHYYIDYGGTKEINK